MKTPAPSDTPPAASAIQPMTGTGDDAFADGAASTGMGAATVAGKTPDGGSVPTLGGSAALRGAAAAGGAATGGVTALLVASAGTSTRALPPLSATSISNVQL